MRCVTAGMAATVLLAFAGGWPAVAAPQPAPAGSGAPADVRPSREALDRQLEQILQRPDFRRAMRRGGRDPRDVGQWLWLRIRSLLDRLGGLHEQNHALFVVSLVVGIVLLALIGGHIAYTVWQALRPGRAQGRAPEARAAERLLTPLDLTRQAEKLAGQGEYRPAVRSLYLALLRRLQMDGVLPRTGARTNWENLRHLAGRPRLAAIVEPFTRLFEEKWYGGREASQQDVALCRAWMEQALQEVVQP